MERCSEAWTASARATRAWFGAAFAEPTPAQVGAWAAIAAGPHALVVAPTGSGKTLSAFLWSLDRLLTTEPARPDKTRRSRVLYVSPLKALAVDVERNLRAPLTGIRHTAERLGVDGPRGHRRACAPATPRAADRRRLGTTPPDILITTPESLFLMLTSQARETLRGVETVIVDEVHAVAGTKRGAHLARQPRAARRPARPAGPAHRPVGHRPPARGGRPLPRRRRARRDRRPAPTKQWDLEVVVPVEDMTAPGEYDEDADGRRPRAGSIWPHVEEHVVDLIEQHRSTIVFANSRRLAERLTARLNEIAAERRGRAMPTTDRTHADAARPR